MKKSYERFTQEELILRDHLAIDRTIMANERTFLSYIRTTLALIVVGATVIQLRQEWYMEVVGGAFILCGIVLLGIGIKRTSHIAKDISHAKKVTPDH